MLSFVHSFGRLGIFSLRPTSGQLARLPQSSNREVGDIFTPAYKRTTGASPAIPQPGGWGYFHSGLQADNRRVSRNPPTGRLGIFSLRPTSGQPPRLPQSPHSQTGENLTLAFHAPADS